MSHYPCGINHRIEMLVSPVEMIVAIVVAVVGSSGAGTIVAWALRKLDSKNDPLHEGVRVLLFCKLEAIQQQMVQDGGVCDVPTKQTAEQIYSAYHAMGGNGVGTQMIEDIRRAHIE